MTFYVLKPRPRRTVVRLEDRFMAFVVRTYSTCWEWAGCHSKDGYGQIRVAGVTLYAHRVSHELFIGPIPPLMDVCHNCDNPGCVNPDHFFLGTRQDNMIDCVLKGRLGERRGEAAGSAIMTVEKVLSLRARYQHTQESADALAAEFGIGRGTVYGIAYRQTWTHV